MSDVFLSYSRRDDVFARHLHEALGDADQDVWADWEDIAPTADWMATIYEAIEDADAFVFVISPDSVGSEICGRELAHAAGLNKRIIPLLRGAVDPKLVPEPAARQQWIGFTSDEGFGASVAELEEALATDLEWAAAHTHWLRRARDWDDGGREKSKLVRGTDLRAAEQWLSEQRPDRTPEPTALQSEYVGASRRAAARRQRIGLIGVVAALVIAIALAAVALVQRNAANDQKDIAQEQTRQAQSQALAASASALVGSDPALSTRLAAEALRTSPTAHAEATLRRSLAGVRNSLLVTGQGDVIWSLAYSPDGTQIATAGNDGTVFVTDAESGEQLEQLQAGAAVFDVAFSPDGTQIATGDGDGTAHIFDAASGKQLTSLRVGEGVVPAVAFSPDGRHIAAANGQAMIRIFELASGRSVRKLSVGAYDLAFSLSGDRLAVAGTQGVRMFEVRSGRELTHPRTGGTAYGVAFSPTGGQIAVASLDVPPEVLQAGTGRRVQTFRNAAASTAVAFSPDGDQVATSGGTNGTVKVWAIASGKAVAALRGHTAAVMGVQFSPDGDHLATASRDGTARVWDLAARDRAEIPPGQGEKVDDVAYSPDGSELATAGKTSARVFDTSSDERTQVMRVGSVVETVVFSPDGTRLATASRDHTAAVWDIQTGERLVRMRGHDGPVFDAAFSPDGARLVTASTDHTARIWDSDSGELIKVIHLGVGAVYSVAYSPDASLIAAGGRFSASLRNATTGGLVHALQSHDTVRAVTFSPDGDRVATGFTDGTAQVADSATGDPLVTMRGHSGAVTTVAFSPDGGLVGTSSEDGTARLWDSETAEQVALLQNGESRVWSVAFSPDGSQVATADNRARIIRCGFACASAGELLAAADARAGVLTAGERVQYLGE